MKAALAVALLLGSVALADIAKPPPAETPPPAEQPAPPPAPAPAAKHPEGVEKAYAGVIQGGWEYVYAAYGLGTAGVLAYAVSLFVRRPKKSAA
ncbi:MAG: hypothetical protein MUC96_10410 [Myxococcaceae bacterium]|jgi:hypothetical protein|nr:hypothetical protein [Myxococcaceae bacterium]